MTASEPLVTKESGTAAVFQIALDTKPSAEVTVPISSSNTAEGAVSVSNLLFTPTNWNVPQTVTVTGLADTIVDGDTPYSIVAGPSTSADPLYSGLDAADVAAMNIDNNAAGFVYWADFKSDLIQRSRLDGSQVQTLVDFTTLFGGTPSNYAPCGVAVDLAGGKMYWGDSTAGRIQCANLDGSNVETLVSGFTGGGLRGGVALDVAPGRCIGRMRAAQKIRRANLDGSGVQDLVTGLLSGAREIDLDLTAGKMYWADIEENNIRRANLDGSNVEVLWTGVEADGPNAIELDVAAGKMYWTDMGRDQIRRANLDGTNVEVVVDMATIAAHSAISGLGLDVRAGKMYWTDLQTETLYRANLDGSDAGSDRHRSGRPNWRRNRHSGDLGFAERGLSDQREWQHGRVQDLANDAAVGRCDDPDPVEQFAGRIRVHGDCHVHSLELERAEVGDGHGCQRRERRWQRVL